MLRKQVIKTILRFMIFFHTFLLGISISIIESKYCVYAIILTFFNLIFLILWIRKLIKFESKTNKY